MEWNVKNALSRDVEREHLNKILQEIQGSIERAASGSLTATEVAQMIQDALPSNTGSSFTITLEGDVTGDGTVVDLNDVTITATLDPDLVGVPEAPIDSNAYWREGASWQAVPGTLRSLAVVEGSGILVNDEDTGWQIREIEGETGEIDVTDGDGVAGNPVIGLADVTVGVGGTLALRSFDSKGRLSEEDAATSDDLAEGTTNLYISPADQAKLDLISSGTYTPTAFSTMNVSTLTIYVARWTRIGNIVTVYGLMDIGPTTTSVTRVQLTLPIPSNFATAVDCAGVTATFAEPARSGNVIGNSTNDTAVIEFTPTGTTTFTQGYTYSYTVI